MSIWNIDEKKRNIEKLNSNKKVDILIIGAGITGLTTAYFLKNKNICVVDASIIGHGITLNSTAKINYLQENIYNNIINNSSYENATLYLESQIYASKLLKEIVLKERINCDLKEVPSYLFSSNEKDILTLKKEVEFLRNNNIDIKSKKIIFNKNNYDAYYVKDTYIFNPIKYLKFLYKKLNSLNIPIYENTKVLRIQKLKDKYICFGKNFKITANKVIMASQYPYFTFPFMLPIKSYIEKSYMVVSRVKKDKNLTFISLKKPVYSCRFYENKGKIYQISLAKSHNTAYKQNDKKHFEDVKKIFNLKEKDIIMKYSNEDVMTPDSLPYIGEIRKNLYVATGFNTWGMTNGVLSAKIISDNILGYKNKYANLFNPNRITFLNLLKVPAYIFNNLNTILGTKIFKNKNWYPKNVSFINDNGKSLACFEDENGKKHIVYNKCPHLGCSLLFNEEEKTWDCPCHSSRFDIDGKCIKGPTNYDISVNNKPLKNDINIK